MDTRGETLYPARFEIRFAGHLDAGWEDWFGALALEREPEGQSVLRGPVLDQAALHGILARLQQLNLPLIAVNRLPEPAVDAGAAH